MPEPETYLNEPDLEQHLAQALARCDPPPGFAARVLARAQSQPPQVPATARSPLRRWYALAAVLLCALFLAAGYERQRQREERADRQFDQALRITDQALDQTRQQLDQAGIRLSP